MKQFVQIEEDQKLVNGQTLKESLAEATELLEDEIRFLMREGPNLLDSKFTSGNDVEPEENETEEKSVEQPKQPNKEKGSTEGRQSRSVAIEELSPADREFVKKLVDEIFEKRQVISLNRTKARLPGRNVILYGGGMLCLFTLAFK